MALLRYRPSSMSKANQVVEIGDRFILTVSDCVGMIATAKIGNLLQSVFYSSTQTARIRPM